MSVIARRHCSTRLTETYNALVDPADSTPEIVALRRLHEALDGAVLDAYGQPQIAVPLHNSATPAERNERLAKQEARAAKRAQS